MKVLHVLSHSLPHVDGYSVRSANILQLQRECGLVPVVITSPRQEGVAPLPSEHIDGVLHYRTPLVAGALPGARLLYRHIAEVVRQERPDLIHAHTPSLWGVPAYVVARGQGLPFVYEVRSCWEDAAVGSGKTRPLSARYRLTRALETWLMRRAAAVIPICEGLAQEIAQRGIPTSKLFVAPNGVDSRRFSPRARDTDLAARLRLPPEALVVGFVGSVIAGEGIEDLVEAVPLIMQRVPSLHLVIAGTGSRLDAVRAAQRRLPHPERVHVLGAVPPAEVTRYYSLLDVVVYPRRSTRQTEQVTPLKPLEAMAMEKALLVANVGGLRELVDDSAGMMFRSGDVPSLAQQCIALLCDPGLRSRLGREARRRVAETRSWSRLGPVYRRAYAAAGGRWVG